MSKQESEDPPVTNQPQTQPQPGMQPPPGYYGSQAPPPGQGYAPQPGQPQPGYQQGVPPGQGPPQTGFAPQPGYGQQPQMQPGLFGQPQPGYQQGVPPGQGPPQTGFAPQPGYGQQPQMQPGLFGQPQPGYQQGVHPGQGPPQTGFAPQPGYGQQPQMQPGMMMGGQPAPQQQQQQWMARPQAIPGCPAGLEYLTQIDQLLVQQQVELLELFTNWEVSNKYQIKNSMGQQVYFAGEESDACMRQCCGQNRGFIMHITDNMGQEVIRVVREFKCCAGCCWCANADTCAFELAIEAPPGEIVGYIRQQQYCVKPHFKILDAHRETMLQVFGPTCIIQGPCCTADQEFIVHSADMQHEVGKISKQWSGFAKEYFTSADNFGVNFPMDLDVKMKAVMIGAVFLIDFMFFENKNNNNR